MYQYSGPSMNTANTTVLKNIANIMYGEKKPRQNHLIERALYEAIFSNYMYFCLCVCFAALIKSPSTATVVPTKSDSDVIFCLQLFSQNELSSPIAANFCPTFYLA